MGSLILDKECKKCRVAKVVLNSRVARGTPQAGVIETRDYDFVISISAHQVIVPIIGGNDFARLSLEVAGVSLNDFSDGASPAYAVGVPLIRNYAGDPTGIYKWPSDFFPLYKGQEPYRALGGRWNYRWTLPDGSDYPLGPNDHWIAEFFIIQRCQDHVNKF